MKRNLLTTLFAATLLTAFGQVGANDPSFNPEDTGFGNGDGPNSTVYSTAVQTDGKILIGGLFYSCNGKMVKGIARLNLDGSWDSAFDPGSGTSSSSFVFDIAIQGDGKILIAGKFSSYNGIGRNGIARLNADGSLDTGFNPGTGANDDVRTVAIQANGKIVIGGRFTAYNGTGRNSVARLNTDGSLDTSFNPGTGANSTVNSTNIQADGKIIIGGYFSIYNGTARIKVARLNTDGSLDMGFTSPIGQDGGVLSTAIQADGKIIVGGDFRSYYGYGDHDIFRLNTDGTLDAVFNSGMANYGIINSTRIQDDGKIIIGGDFDSYNGTARNRIARLNSNGSLDSSFDPGTGANYPVNATSLQANGQVIIGGQFSNYKGTNHNYLARLNANGTLDTGFISGTGADFYVGSITVQDDDKIIIGGGFTTFNGTSRSHIARLNADGSLDLGFDPGSGCRGGGSQSAVTDVALQADGKIIIVGTFSSYNGTGRNCIARLNSDGSLDTDFDPGTGASSVIRSVALQPDGKIVIAGWFTTYNGANRIRIARLNTDGSLDTSFNPGTGANNGIFSTVIQADGQIIIGGDFTNYNGTSRNRIARLNNDGSLDTSFKPGTGADNYINCVAIQADEKILIGGVFSSFNGSVSYDIARLNADGKFDLSFVPSTEASGVVASITVQADGKILVGGGFSSYNGTGRNAIARLNEDGSLDTGFDPGTGAQYGSGVYLSQISSIASQGDGKIIIGGLFTSYDGEGRNRIARILVSDACVSQLDPDPGAEFSCGATGMAVNGMDRIYAIPVPGANKYQFQFKLPGYSAARTLTSNTAGLLLKERPGKAFLCGTYTYNVRVRASFDGGATYCDYGPVCTVEITDNTASCISFVPQFGINDTRSEAQDIPTMEIFPNPVADGHVTLALSGFATDATEFTVELFDLYGRKVMERMIATDDVQAENTMLDLPAQLPTGVYLLSITAGTERFTEQLMVK